MDSQIANGIAGYKEEHPEASDEDAVKTLLPEAKFAISDTGEVAMQIDGASLPCKGKFKVPRTDH